MIPVGFKKKKNSVVFWNSSSITVIDVALLGVTFLVTVIKVLVDLFYVVL